MQLHGIQNQTLWQCSRIVKAGRGGTDHVPKRVDPGERREAISEAVYQVIGDRGWDAVTLRDVASTAGVSMGQVQHYFATKSDMLIFALTHMRARVLARLQRQLAALPQPVTQREQIRAAIRVMLPVDEAGRQEAAVNIAFFSAATVTPEYAQGLRDGYARQLAFARTQFTTAAADDLLRDGIDPGKEAEALYFLIQGLTGPVLIGQLAPEAALDILDHQLSRIFRPPTP
jgi:AcrR family transcriptional regulator